MKHNNAFSATTASGIIFVAYGIQVEDRSRSKDNAFAFNEYDLWFGRDFDWVIDNMMNNIWDEIESDITSDWSTNESEQLS